jgi:uncharacterized protein
LSSKVYFIKAQDNEPDESLCSKLEKLIYSEELLSFITERDIAAVKTHFGEVQGLGNPRPLYLKMIGDIVKTKGGLPFLTETSTLYKGNRNNAIKHIAHAHSQGFDYAATGMPIIMADGLFGDDEFEVPVSGKIFKSVRIAALFKKCNALIVVSHFTGHVLTGFGASLKNIGMGCCSRKAKLAQHTVAKPGIKEKRCTLCGTCLTWCPAGAISLNEKCAVIDADKCIGCGQCLAMCRFDAVKFKWDPTYETVQKNIVEHAMGIHKLYENKSLYINILTRISKDCDCENRFERITPDVGLLVSTDPVAVDAASLDCVEKNAGLALGKLAYDIPSRIQLDYSAELNFGSVEYELVEI